MPLELAAFALIALLALVAVAAASSAPTESPSPDKKAIREAVERAFARRAAEAETHESSEKLQRVLEAARKSVIAELEKIGAA